MQLLKQDTFKIVLTGPESSGKTSMAVALAKHFNTIWAPEFARFYLPQLHRTYQQSDLEAIGKGQLAWETWYGQKTYPLYFCDTDWTVLQIWEQYKYGMNGAYDWYWKKGYSEAIPADLYFLCSPDFPWEPDPLRENPTDRDALFDQYEQLLLNFNANYCVLNGSHNERLQTAISQLAKLFSTLP